jgi:hypothetical protein
MEPGYSPREVFEYAFQHVWLIALLTLFGGLVGLGVHSLRKPVYEASAVFSISFDFKQTGGLTQLEEDHSWDMLGFLIKSSAVYDRVAQRAAEDHILVKRSDLNDQFTSERQETIYYLRVRNTDPKTAAALANIWADESKKQFDDALQQALKVDALNRYMHALEACLASAPAQSPSDGFCQVSRLTDVETLLKSTSIDLATEERDASRAISPAVTYTLSQKADVPTRPVAFNRNTLVLSGSIIGLLISIWVVAGRLPEKLANRRRHA